MFKEEVLSDFLTELSCSGLNKQSKVNRFLQNEKDDDSRIQYLVKIFESGDFVEKNYYKNSISQLHNCASQCFSQKNLPEICARFFDDNDAESRRDFIELCVSRFFLNNFEVFKEIALDFDRESFDALTAEDNVATRDFLNRDRRREELLQEKMTGLVELREVEKVFNRQGELVLL